MKTKSSNSRKDSKKIRPMVDQEKKKQLTNLGRSSKDGREHAYEKEEEEKNKKGIGSPLGGKAEKGKVVSNNDLKREREVVHSEFIDEFEEDDEEWEGSKRNSGKKKGAVLA